MKVFVEVNSMTSEGYTFLRDIHWPDGRVFHIDQQLEAGMIQLDGEYVMRYKIIVQGKTRFIYEAGGRWFVIAKDK